MRTTFGAIPKIQREGTLWRADWRRSGRRFELFLTENKRIKVCSSKLQDGVEELEEMVTEKLNDPVPHFEFVTPLPSGTDREGIDFIFCLSAHDKCEDVQNAEKLFTNGRCSKCGNLSGARTDTPVELRVLPEGDLVFTEFGQIISAALCQFLRLECVNNVLLRPLTVNGKVREDFFELASGIRREFVAVKDQRLPQSAFRCSACGFEMILYLPFEAPFTHYLSRDDIPYPRPTIFPIGTESWAKLAVSLSVRRAIVGSRRFKNIVSRKVGILESRNATPPSACRRNVSG